MSIKDIDLEEGQILYHEFKPHECIDGGSHKYDEDVELPDKSGYSLKCSKCGMLAIDESMFK